MRTFKINTLGCKVNQYEGQQIRSLLEELGLKAASAGQKPDLILINTCCVTHHASAKSRQYIAKARKLSPQAAIVVRGCLPSAQTGELEEHNNGFYRINHQQDISTELKAIIDNHALLSTTLPASPTLAISKTTTVHKSKHKNKLPFAPLATLKSYRDQTRAFLKIQDGCDAFCTYCIVRKIRTSLYSKPVDVVLEEAQNLVNAGHKEIVLTGIFLGAYLRPTARRHLWQSKIKNPESNIESPLAFLLEKLVAVPGLFRLRLSSLEPADVTPDLMDVFGRHKDVLVPHFHLPLQSGSESVLKRMARQYTAAEFRQTVALLKSRLDRPAITADIIVGFPGETQEDFQATVDLARSTGFAKMHIFPFSPRKTTPAADMPDQIPQNIIKQRAKILADLDKELCAKFREQFLGETASIIVESTKPCPTGRTERYFMLAARGVSAAKGELLNIRLTPDSLPADLSAQYE